MRGSDPKDMPLGRWPDVTIGEARKRKSAIVASISGGGNPWQERAEERRRKAGTTLKEAFSEWLETVARDKRTRDQDELRYPAPAPHRRPQPAGWAIARTGRS